LVGAPQKTQQNCHFPQVDAITTYVIMNYNQTREKTKK